MSEALHHISEMAGDAVQVAKQVVVKITHAVQPHPKVDEPRFDARVEVKVETGHSNLPALANPSVLQSPIITIRLDENNPVTFTAHQPLLERSSVFADYLAQGNNILILEEDFDVTSFSHFLQWLYTGDFSYSNIHELTNVSRIASAFKVEDLQCLVSEKMGHEFEVVSDSLRGEEFGRRVELLKFMYGPYGEQNKDNKSAVVAGLVRDAPLLHQNEETRVDLYDLLMSKPHLMYDLLTNQLNGQQHDENRRFQALTPKTSIRGKTPKKVTFEFDVKEVEESDMPDKARNIIVAMGMEMANEPGDFDLNLPAGFTTMLEEDGEFKIPSPKANLTHEEVWKGGQNIVVFEEEEVEELIIESIPRPPPARKRATLKRKAAPRKRTC